MAAADIHRPSAAIIPFVRPAASSATRSRIAAESLAMRSVQAVPRVLELIAELCQRVRRRLFQEGGHRHLLLQVALQQADALLVSRLPRQRDRRSIGGDLVMFCPQL